MADNLNTRAIVYDMLMSIEKENTPTHILLSELLSVGFSGEHWNMRFFWMA